jgi:hypothetical protein
MTTPPTLTPAMAEQFFALLTRLSPENLYADGERTADVAQRIERSLKAQWRSMEADLGRPVSEDEVWAIFLTTTRGSRVAARWGV